MSRGGNPLKARAACRFRRCSTPGCRSDTGDGLEQPNPKATNPMTFKHPMLPPGREIETIEPFAIQATFADALARVEHIGPCRQLVFSLIDQGSPGTPVRAIVAKLILPAEALQAIAAQLLAAAPADSALTLAIAARDGATAH